MVLRFGHENAGLTSTTDASIESDSYRGGVAPKFQNHNWLASAGVIYRGSQINTTRTDLVGTNTAEYNVTYIGAQARVAYLMEREGYYLKPVLDVNLTSIAYGGFLKVGLQF